jgi:hypothetical protein
MRGNSMRPVFAVALLGTTLSTNPVTAQSSTDKPASDAAEKKAETHSKPPGWLFENGPEPKSEAARREALARRDRAKTAPSAESTEPPTPRPAAPSPAPIVPTVQAVPPGPPQKNLTGAEFSQIRVGSSEKEVLTVLGPASSKVVVPDDDGHMRETLQYWVKGVPMGTVRLDNGHVFQIETKQK